MIKHVNHRSVFEREESATRLFLVTETDLQAVESVGLYRLILGEQLRQLHWPRASQRRHAESRLRGLFHAGWLDRTPFLDGLARPRAVYTLGRLGRSHVARLAGIPTSAVGPRPAKEHGHDLLFLKHHLMTVQSVINLTLAAKASGGSLVRYSDERALKAYRAKTRGMPVIPDAYVVLRVNDRAQPFCIELDRATVDLRSWRSRVLNYLQWTAMPSFKDDFGRPIVLIVVEAKEPTASRRLMALKTLIETTAEAASADASLFLLASLASATSNSILTQPIWSVGGQSHPFQLVP